MKMAQFAGVRQSRMEFEKKNLKMENAECLCKGPLNRATRNTCE